MKLQHGKDIRTITDEMGNELFKFTGTHLDDLNMIMKRMNTDISEYSIRRVILDIVYHPAMSTSEKFKEIKDLL